VEQLTLAEAAKRMGTTAEALRKRIHRGTLPSVKVDGKVYVSVPAGAAVPPPGGRPDEPLAPPTTVHLASGQMAFLAMKQAESEIAYLRQELVRRDSVEEELRAMLSHAQAVQHAQATIIAQLTQPLAIAAPKPAGRSWWQFWRPG